MRLTVVVPVLDEAARIGARLGALRATAGVAEIVVVDGGSRDGTVAIAARVDGVRVLRAPRGRGTQMNVGARAATGDVLCFLHADAVLPADAAAHIAAALAAPGVVGGAFRLHTVCDDGINWLGPLLRLADVRSRVTRFPYGDQAIFVRRDVFVGVGGFPDQPIMEDVELARRLRRVGRLRTVAAEVRVSGRRFLRDPVRAVLAMRLLPLLYRLGVSPRTLARLYGNPR
ncbi:MAG: TIGR04283 family arsenosugar biosynthesis glycosyltransferase [bacterium]|nr:TIGR04283 family arsenosugar biosynthesis glycosyltransferase [bacterium]